MRELKYDIGLNDHGNPFVDVSKEYEENPEDKFVVFELTKYMLMKITPNIKNPETKAEVDFCIDALGKLSGYVGNLLKGIMIKNGEIDKLMNKNFAIDVESYDELIDLVANNARCGYLIYDAKMYDIDKGINFKVKKTGETYSYFDGEIISID